MFGKKEYIPKAHVFRDGIKELNLEELKDIPIVSSIVNVIWVEKNVHDRNLLKQTLFFINEFNSNTINDEKLDSYKSSIENDYKKCEEELGRVILLLNNFVDKEKSIFLAKIFKAYVSGKLNWNEFCEHSEIINRLFLQDAEILRKVSKEDIKITSNRTDEFRIERLNSLGLIGVKMQEPTWKDIADGEIDNIKSISALGKKFCNIVFD